MRGGLVRVHIALLAFAALTLSAPRADALLCVAIVGCSCNVVASDVDFGDVNPLVGTDSAIGTISVDCTGVADVAPSVSTRITAGQWGTFATRKMRSSAGDLLNYNLYTTSQATNIWGDGTGGTSTVSINGGLLSLGHWSASRDVHAVVSPATTTKPGSYSDQVVVRIVW